MVTLQPYTVLVPPIAAYVAFPWPGKLGGEGGRGRESPPPTHPTHPTHPTLPNPTQHREANSSRTTIGGGISPHLTQPTQRGLELKGPSNSKDPET